MANNIKEINREFYNKLYSSKNVFFGLVHTLLSFDQQSKSRRNYREIKTVIKNADPDDETRFLDYGFGHGSLLIKLPKSVAVFGCDISDEAVITFGRIADLLKRDIRVATVEDFDELTKGVKFDVISCSHVLEHVDDDNILVAEFKRLLKPNGKLVINLPINEVWKDPKHVRTYTKQSASDLLEKHGFKIIKISEEDKMTGFFLKYEESSGSSKALRFFFRILRLTYGVLPQVFSSVTEKMMSAKHENQQLIIIAANNG